MSRFVASLTGLILILTGSGPARAASARASARPTGREAVAVARQDWKKNVSATIRGAGSGLRLTGALPKNFGRLSAQERLDFLHARRDLNAQRFDRFHPTLGRILQRDDRLRASLGQDCRPLNGLVPDTPYWRYLHFRRNLAPRRFDRYHPVLGAILAQDLLLRSGTLCPPVIVPPPIVVGPPEEPQIINPPGVPSPNPPSGGGGGGGEVIQAVPEPGSLALIVLGIAAAAAPRWLGRMRARRLARA